MVKGLIRRPLRSSRKNNAPGKLRVAILNKASSPHDSWNPPRPRKRRMRMLELPEIGSSLQRSYPDVMLEYSVYQQIGALAKAGPTPSPGNTEPKSDHPPDHPGQIGATEPKYPIRPSPGNINISFEEGS